MLSLDSPDWAKLKHAYGDAADIPYLLRQLESFPDADGASEPWFSIWSALAHQGDVYSASFASVPHVVRILTASPALAPAVYLQFATWIEICRQKARFSVPLELAAPYFEALSMLPSLVCAASSRDWDFDFLRIALSAMAVSKDSALMAQVLQELDQSAAEAFLS